MMDPILWESVFAEDIPGDQGPTVHYWVLFVPKEQADYAWNLIRYFTLRNRLGNRSAISPNPMSYGGFKGYYTIILDSPFRRMRTVSSFITSIGLEEFINSQRTRVKFRERRRFSLRDNNDDLCYHY